MIIVAGVAPVRSRKIIGRLLMTGWLGLDIERPKKQDENIRNDRDSPKNSAHQKAPVDGSLSVLKPVTRQRGAAASVRY
jgi:hypothetical protein